MDRDKNLLENEQLLKNLFDNLDEKDEKLYKNDLFIPSTEKEELFLENSQKNQTEIIRDKILKKLSLEDYTPFPPKNDSILMNDIESGKDKEDQEKLFEEEIDHLRNLHRLNYLTFSPFGISFFPNLNNMIKKNEEKNQNTYNLTEEEIEKENKLLNIIDFDYNNYEINNDLLFNISMGFIDIDKLKHENAVSSENFIPRSQRFTNERQFKNFKSPTRRPKIENNKKQPENIFNKDVEFKEDLMNKLVHFVKENENVEFYTSTINEFYKELNILSTMNNNKEKNKLLLRCEKIFIERQKLYLKYLADQQEKERKRRRQEKKQKELEKNIEQLKIKNFNKKKKFDEHAKRIGQKGIKHHDKSSTKSVNFFDYDFRRDYSMEKIGIIRREPTPSAKSLLSLRSNSSGSLKKIENKISNKYSNISISKIERKSSNYNDERYGYQKSNNDYYFKLI